MAVVAAWRVHCYVSESSATMTHLEFRRQVTLGLLKGSARHRMGGPTAPVVPDVRYDGVQHYIHSTTQGRCALCCKECAKCGKRMHTQCFEIFHTPH
jgi:hypothetical protein